MRSFFAADHFDHFVEPHLANIDKIVRTLGHGGNPVPNFESPILLRWTPRNEALDLGVSVFGAQHRADPD